MDAVRDKSAAEAQTLYMRVGIGWGQNAYDLALTYSDVACVEDYHCDGGQVCSAGACIDCVTAADCGPDGAPVACNAGSCECVDDAAEDNDDAAGAADYTSPLTGIADVATA